MKAKPYDPAGYSVSWPVPTGALLHVVEPHEYEAALEAGGIDEAGEGGGFFIWKRPDGLFDGCFCRYLVLVGMLKEATLLQALEFANRWRSICRI